jgi:hypothetical protein
LNPRAHSGECESINENGPFGALSKGGDRKKEKIRAGHNQKLNSAPEIQSDADTKSH